MSLSESCRPPTRPERAQLRGEAADKTTTPPVKSSVDAKPALATLDTLKRFPQSPCSWSIESEAGEEPRHASPQPLPKRRISDDDDDGSGGRVDQHLRKRARLTRDNLAALEKMTRRRNGTSLESRLDSTVKSSSTKSTSTTSDGFALQATRNGILHPIHSAPPENLDEVRNQLSQARKSSSPTGSVYEDYVHKVSSACNEATMVFEVGHKLLKEYPKENYSRAFNQAFTGFPKDVGFNNGLSTPQPDFVEGLQMVGYGSFPVNEYVDGAMLFKDDPFSLTLPQVAGEWKGRGKDMEEARLQSAFDGAALVYARNQALEYAESPDPANHAKVTTFTTDGTNLNFFSHYATPSGEDGALKYHQYPIASTNMKSSHDEFRKGWRQLRNAQDRAREQSYQLRDQLKQQWEVNKLQPTALAALEEEDESEVIEEQPADQLIPSAPSKPVDDGAPPLCSFGMTPSTPQLGAELASGSGAGTGTGTGTGHNRKGTSPQSSGFRKKPTY